MTNTSFWLLSRGSVALVLLLSLRAGPALARECEGANTPKHEAMKREAALSHGDRLRKQEKYLEAIAEYRAAQNICSTPALRLDIAQTYEKAGHAKEAYQYAIGEGLDHPETATCGKTPEQKTECRELAERLRPRLRVRARSGGVLVREAKVWARTSKSSAWEPMPLDVATVVKPGVWTVEVRAEGFGTKSEEITLEPRIGAAANPYGIDFELRRTQVIDLDDERPKRLPPAPAPVEVLGATAVEEPADRPPSIVPFGHAAFVTSLFVTSGQTFSARNCPGGGSCTFQSQDHVLPYVGVQASAGFAVGSYFSLSFFVRGLLNQSNPEAVDGAKDESGASGLGFAGLRLGVQTPTEKVHVRFVGEAAVGGGDLKQYQKGDVRLQDGTVVQGGANPPPAGFVNSEFVVLGGCLGADGGGSASAVWGGGAICPQAYVDLRGGPAAFALSVEIGPGFGRWPR
jgi:hypothetical protein